ncbi:MAG: 50S ribosomal protein L28, partial [Planctomycetota bacterium]
MPRVCAFTGKRTTTGFSYTLRGKKKYLGGVGTKVTGKTKRTFK